MLPALSVSAQPLAFFRLHEPPLRQATATQPGVAAQPCLHEKSVFPPVAAPRSPPAQSLPGKSTQLGSGEGETEGETERDTVVLAVKLRETEALAVRLPLSEREALPLAVVEASSLRLTVALHERLRVALGDAVAEAPRDAEREGEAVTLAAGEAVRAVRLPLPLRDAVKVPEESRLAEREGERLALAERLPLPVALALTLGVRLRVARNWQQPRRAALQLVSTTAPPAALPSTERQAPAPAGAGARQSEALFAAK